MVFKPSMLNCLGVPSAISIYVNSPIYETYLVQWSCMQLWSIDGRSICHAYMCIGLYLLDLPSLVQWYSRHLCSIDRRVHLPLVYMCILQYVKLLWCNGLACSYGQLVGRSICLQFICALSYMWNLFGVMVLHAAMVNLGGSIYLQYICALSYVSNLCGVMVCRDLC